MGPKIVSQMIKEEEATHSKGQADSQQLKISRFCTKKLEERKFSGLLVQPVSTGRPSLPRADPSFSLHVRCVGRGCSLSSFLTWRQPLYPAPSSTVTCFSSRGQHPCLAPEIFQHSRFVTTLRPCPFQPCPSRSPSGPVIIISDNWTQKPLSQKQTAERLARGRALLLSGLLSSCWKRPFVSQKCITFPEVSSYILLHVPCTFR